ncbi:Proline-rich receptor-like protein kinase PERK8 [Linum perenne]
MIMEGDSHSPSAAASASVVVIAFDATKERSVKELKATIDGVRGKGDILSPGDRLVFLGVLDKVPHPMGYQVKACPDSFAGASIRVMEEEVIKKVDIYVNKLSKSAGVCVDERVCVEVTMAAGTPPKQVVLQEVATFNAAWLILDRHLKRDLKFYLAQIPCKVALIHDDLSVEVERDHTRNVSDVTEQKTFYATSRHVPILDYQGYRNSRQSVIPCINYPLSGDSVNDSKWGMDRNNSPAISISTNQGGSGQVSCVPEAEVQHHAESQIIRRQISDIFRQRSSEEPILCSICGIRTDLNVKESMRFSISEIQLATDNFSVTNLLGEGGYGHVYKGRLHGGQFIAAKVHKEESAQGFSEFQSEIQVLNFARHKNIVMLMGFCCKENINILVYEYICNKSLHSHLFDKTESTLQWHQRQAIAIGIGKGLRFLHEECRGSPIIHRDLRPSNVLLTHDFVPMVGDFGLARWKTIDPVHTRLLGTLGYLAPEYVESGCISVRTDVYAFGVILLQLISGRKVIDAKQLEGQQSIREWAVPLIEELALHKLIDPRLGESYDTYELYQMAKAAYLCVQRNPEKRPSAGQVLSLLEGKDDHMQHFRDHFDPSYSSL